MFEKLENICEINGCGLSVNVVSPILPDLNYYDKELQLITISKKALYGEEKQLAIIFCHELAHHLQNKKGLLPFGFEKFNDYLNLELEAERIAYYLSIYYFPEIELKHKHFCKYTKKEDILSLKSAYYGNYN